MYVNNLRFKRNKTRGMIKMKKKKKGPYGESIGLRLFVFRIWAPGGVNESLRRKTRVQISVQRNTPSVFFLVLTEIVFLRRVSHKSLFVFPNWTHFGYCLWNTFLKGSSVYDSTRHSYGCPHKGTPSTPETRKRSDTPQVPSGLYTP